MTTLLLISLLLISFFFFNDTATTEIYTLSLHDALPIFISKRRISGMALLILALLQRIFLMSSLMLLLVTTLEISFAVARSEERFSRNAETDLVCRLLLEKKKLKLPPHTFTLATSARCRS